jgi:hypothetical protein
MMQRFARDLQIAGQAHGRDRFVCNVLDRHRQLEHKSLRSRPSVGEMAHGALVQRRGAGTLGN